MTKITHLTHAERASYYQECAADWAFDARSYLLNDMLTLASKAQDEASYYAKMAQDFYWLSQNRA